jgi:hypothetical protein
MRSALPAAWCLLIVCILPACAGIEWDAVPEVYTLRPDGSILASDGGGSTPDNYLLSKRAYRDFILEFDVMQAGPMGEKSRTIVCWGVDPENHNNRACYFLSGRGISEDAWTHVRLVVISGNAALFMDGVRTGGDPTTYETPLAEGRVGLLHYYNYNYEFRNLSITPLTADALPAPAEPEVTFDDSGVMALRWSSPGAYAGVLGHRIYRAEGANVAAEPDLLIATVQGSEYRDAGLRSNTAYTYLIVPVVGGDTAGKPSAPVSVHTGQLPAPSAPAGVTAIRRIDGTVRVRWQAGGAGRLRGYQVSRGASEQQARGARPFAELLPPDSDSVLIPGAADAFYAVAAVDPEGKPRCVRCRYTRRR